MMSPTSNGRRLPTELAHTNRDPYIDEFGRIFLGDFWEWSCSDVLSPEMRPIFAEFLTLRLLGIANSVHGEKPLFQGFRVAALGEGSEIDAAADLYIRWRYTSPEDEAADPFNLAYWSFRILFRGEMLTESVSASEWVTAGALKSVAGRRIRALQSKHD